MPDCRLKRALISSMALVVLAAAKISTGPPSLALETAEVDSGVGVFPLQPNANTASPANAVAVNRLIRPACSMSHSPPRQSTASMTLLALTTA